MKLWTFLPLALGILVFSGCKEREEVAPVTVVPETVEKTTAGSPIPPEPAVPVLSAAERAARVKGAALVGKDVDYFFTLQNLRTVTEKVRAFTESEGGQLWPEVLDALGNLEEVSRTGNGFFVSYQSAGGGGHSVLRGLSRLFNMLGGLSLQTDLQGLSGDIAVRILLENEQQLVTDLLEALEVGSLTVGLHIPDEKMRENLLSQTVGGLTMVQMLEQEFEVFRPIEREMGDVYFQGLSVSGETILENYGNLFRVHLLEHVSPTLVDTLLGAIGRNSLSLLIGEQDDHLIFFLGRSADDLAFPGGAGESLAAHQRFDLMDRAEESPILALFHEGEKGGVINESATSSWVDSARGLRLGLEHAPGLRDARALDHLLEMFIRQEEGRAGARVVHPRSGVVYLKDGLVLQTRGGTVLDWLTPGKAVLEQGADDSLTASVAVEREAMDKAVARFDLQAAVGMELGELYVQQLGKSLPGAGLSDGSVLYTTLETVLGEKVDPFSKEIYPHLGESLQLQVGKGQEPALRLTSSVRSAEALKTNWATYSREHLESDGLTAEKTAVGEEMVSYVYTHSEGELSPKVILGLESMELNLGEFDGEVVEATPAGLIVKTSGRSLRGLLPVADEDDPDAQSLTPEEREEEDEAIGRLSGLMEELGAVELRLERFESGMELRVEIPLAD